LINQAITSYRLPRSVNPTNKGEVTFEGLDHSKFDNSTLVTLQATDTTLPHAGDECFWITHWQLDGVSVNGSAVALSGSRTALMDTGTTLLVVPSTDIDGVHAKIPGSKRTGATSYSGQHSVPCNTSVALNFGGRYFPIDPENLGGVEFYLK
ncbi:aspartic peptidase domain-containing protein, partial [Mycena leptocephala]